MNETSDCGLPIANWGKSAKFGQYGLRQIFYIPQSAFRNLQSKGFTLIEVLLALSILALVVTAVYASFSTTGENIEQAEAIRDSTDLARTLLAKISDDVANVYVKSNLKYTAFRGKKEEEGLGSDRKRYDSILMTTLTNWRKPDSKEMELWEVGYFFKQKPDGTGFVLMRREKRELGNDVPVGEGGVESQITDRVESLQFRYNTGGEIWIDEWSRNDLPKMVDIALTLDSGMTYTSKVEVRNPKN